MREIAGSIYAVCQSIRGIGAYQSEEERGASWCDTGKRFRTTSPETLGRWRLKLRLGEFPNLSNDEQSLACTPEKMKRVGTEQLMMSRSFDKSEAEKKKKKKVQMTQSVPYYFLRTSPWWVMFRLLSFASSRKVSVKKKKKDLISRGFVLCALFRARRFLLSALLLGTVVVDLTPPRSVASITNVLSCPMDFLFVSDNGWNLTAFVFVSSATLGIRQTVWQKTRQTSQSRDDVANRSRPLLHHFRSVFSPLFLINFSCAEKCSTMTDDCVVNDSHNGRCWPAAGQHASNCFLLSFCSVIFMATVYIGGYTMSPGAAAAADRPMVTIGPQIFNDAGPLAHVWRSSTRLVPLHISLRDHRRRTTLVTSPDCDSWPFFFPAAKIMSAHLYVTAWNGRLSMASQYQLSTSFFSFFKSPGPNWIDFLSQSGPHIYWITATRRVKGAITIGSNFE